MFFSFQQNSPHHLVVTVARADCAGDIAIPETPPLLMRLALVRAVSPVANPASVIVQTDWVSPSSTYIVTAVLSSVVFNFQQRNRIKIAIDELRYCDSHKVRNRQIFSVADLLQLLVHAFIDPETSFNHA
jgi:hypothetical protein